MKYFDIKNIKKIYLKFLSKNDLVNIIIQDEQMSFFAYIKSIELIFETIHSISYRMEKCDLSTRSGREDYKKLHEEYMKSWEFAMQLKDGGKQC